jgi:hypothetical protein
VTIDERIERLEHVTAMHIEQAKQAKKDYQENRQLWREMRTEVEALWKATDRRICRTDGGKPEDVR